MDMLKEYKAEQDEQALKYGDKWVETDRLYTKWNGEPMLYQMPLTLTTKSRLLMRNRRKNLNIIAFSENKEQVKNKRDFTAK